MLLVQAVGSWRDALLAISVMLILAWYAMLGLSKAQRRSTPGGSLLGRLGLSGHRVFAFATLLLMGVGALLALPNPILALTITLPFCVALLCTLGVPHWLRQRP